MTNKTMLEKALETTWDAKERFYQANKNLTIEQIIEKIEGKHFNFSNENRKPCVPIVFN